MKPRLLVSTAAALLLCACDPHAANPPDDRQPAGQAAVSDVPLLPVRPGDRWLYQVLLEIPADVTSPGAAAVETRHERSRTYLGKVAAAEGLPAVDCFEVSVPGSPREREFVEIHDDRILMRGSLILRPETTRPLWFDQPVPFVTAGVKPGTALPELAAGGGQISRQTKVIAREDLTVPAGTFRCIRLLTTGHDGELELRRTVWFAPGHGIVREEKTRYRREQLVYRETQELTAIGRPR
jgi:hypothetical protein